MSNVAQTIAIIASLVVIFGAQTAWILRSFVGVDKRLDRIDTRLDRVEVVLGEHGERLVRIETHVGVPIPHAR
ncbi:MAG: hypothetical protein ACLP0J_28230 [Solirubrobacteraceae bacterium]|jgi:hypothetical protein